MGKLIAKMKKNLDRVLLAAMAGVLVVMMAAYLSERSTPEAEVVREPRGPIESKISSTSFDYAYVEFMMEPVAPMEESDYKELLNFNMFDAKAVRNADQVVEEANRKAVPAAAALSRFEQTGADADRDEARRLALEAQEVIPGYPQAQAVLDRLAVLELEAAAEPTPTPPPAPE